MGGRVNFQVIRALVRRDLRMYFSNPTGYVFITLFIFLSAAAAFWRERFFLNNLATLDQLNGIFPFLLLFFVPAVTMAVWAEERKQGTDELLLTLPATDFEIVAGKYLATLGVYTASLLLSVSHVLVLFWLGSPDLGLMFGNYLGYWLIGAALIAVGMLASLLTANTTIAYILGALLCAMLVALGGAASLFSRGLTRALTPLGVYGHFPDFARGVITFSGLLYFLSVIGLFIYLNTLIVSRRHWPARADGWPMWAHKALRAAGIFLLVISLNAILGRIGLRADVTAERLHSLTGETYRLLGELPEDRTVFVQAYVSPEMPEQFVQTKATLLGVLKEIDAIAGSKVQLLIEETEPYSEEATTAREKFGITSRPVPNLGSARAGFENVFLGVAITCGAEEQVIPFFDRGLPVEYEIARSIRVVARTDRKKVGVVNTKIRLFGGMDFQTFRTTPAWSVVQELRKQYEVVEITPDSPITQELDGLLVPLPSSMTQQEMDNVTAYVEEGTPALFLVDPLPVVNLGLAPSERPGADRNPFMNQGPPPEPKGNIQAMLARLGVRWNPAAITWDTYNPHPDLAHLPQEVVFVGRGNENEEAFNTSDPSSRRLQELVFLYPGQLEEMTTDGIEFTPLVRSGRVSGTASFFQLVQRSFFGAQLNRNLPHQPDENDYIVAARVRSKGAGETAAEAEPDAGSEQESGEEPGTGPTISAVVIADLDFISEQFFEIRRAGPATLNFDNVTFFLNAMDVLMDDESFIELRNRRVAHRTLARVEEQTRKFIEQRAVEEGEAETDARKALEDAQKRLDEKVAEVRGRADLDEQTKQIMARNLQEVESRRFEVLKANIELERDARVQASKENMEAQIRSIQSGIRTFAVLLPPIPVFILGVMIFIRRQRREVEGAAAARRLRE